MTVQDILFAQLLDPFRIGLIIALLVTTARTRAATGTVLPLLFGLIFVAVIIPTTMAGSSAEPLWRLMALGLVANTILLVCALGLHKLFTRRSG